MACKPFEWSVNGNKVSLFPEQENLAFTVTRDEVELGKTRVALRLYNLDYALNLVQLFHSAVEKNLQKDIHPSSFLPILCTDALKLQNGRYTPLLHQRVGLFGRVDRIAQRVLSASIAISDESTGNERFIPLDDISGTTYEEFFLNAPQYNQPNVDKKRNYEMTSYAKRFRFVMTYDDSGAMESIDFKHVSLFDRNVVLDKAYWAVTLLSAKARGSYEAVGGSNEFGHAMITIEGIRSNKEKRNEQFLSYAHLTTKDDPQHPDPNRGDNEARVEILERSPIKGIYGPTWSLTKERVEDLTDYINEERNLSLQGRYIKFSKVGTTRGKVVDGLLVALVVTVTVLQIISAITTGEGGDPITDSIEPPNVGDCQNCGDWCLKTLKKIGVVVHFPTLRKLVATPNQLVEYLQEHPKAVTFH